MGASRTPIELQNALLRAPSPCVVLREQPLADERDRGLFHHAQRFVANDLADASDPSDFWFRFAMPMAHASKPLQYALCALGAANRHFLFTGPGTRWASSEGSLETESIAIEKYNNAIAQIRAHASNAAGEVQTDVIIMCCLIFVCVENLLGRHEQSAQHLRAGACLLTSSPRSKRPRERQALEDTLLRVFYCLGQDTDMYTCSDQDILERVIRHLPPPNMGSRYEPFTNDDEAWETLQGLDVIYDTAIASSARLSVAHVLDHPRAGPVSAGQFPSDEHEALCITREAFKIWSQRFDLYRRSTYRSSFQTRSPHLIARICLEQTIWATLVKMKTFDDPVPIEDHREIMAWVDQVVLTWQEQDGPVFSLGGNIIPVLALVCASCGDRHVRLQVVAKLRSLRRREGFWDSGKIADACEAQLLAGSSGSPQIYLPRGLQRRWR